MFISTLLNFNIRNKLISGLIFKFRNHKFFNQPKDRYVGSNLLTLGEAEENVFLDFHSGMALAMANN